MALDRSTDPARMFVAFYSWVQSAFQLRRKRRSVVRENIQVWLKMRRRRRLSKHGKQSKLLGLLSKRKGKKRRTPINLEGVWSSRIFGEQIWELEKGNGSRGRQPRMAVAQHGNECNALASGWWFRCPSYTINALLEAGEGGAGAK